MILTLLNNYGFDAYVVGGCVRDSLLRRKPQDWDICTNALPEEIIKIFKNHQIKFIETGRKHGTITIVFNNKHFEVTTYRIDGDYLDHRRPENVTFTLSLEKDLARRDFTINAMAYNHKKGLIDYFNGQNDLNKKIIKCVGEAKKRFDEDALRILRGVRFAAQLNFTIHKDTAKAMQEKGFLLKNISQERIRDELIKILLSNKPAKGILLLKNLNLLPFVIQELIDTINLNPKNSHHDKDVFTHILCVLDNTPKILNVRLAALLHDIEKPKFSAICKNHFYSKTTAMNILKRLKFDKKTIDCVCTIIKEHMHPWDTYNTKNLKKFINRIGIQNLDSFFALQVAHVKGSSLSHDISKISNLKNEVAKILNEKQPLTIKDLKINGNDLIKLGIKQGKQIGIILNILLDKVLDDPNLNEKDKLLNIVKNINDLNLYQ
ncbi:CCA tRNA nucleotidyltransferase [Crassaminicella thermophila]|uniref:CCA tRNA nucleotidyltransferase n=1 Tax=Crassaminicella thermophila TaxID=2599308 RepID=A0A5C0SK82_CRATE|nr:CCA tRNA nucleotidyltransferase [Crassaminicella thermophila]QEK13598.1 CCA tRNA nucleotidyltransferase [Crassaminicella thermophila]